MAPNRSVKALETTLEIIDTLREQGPVGVTELADHLEMGKSSVHHHLSTLRERDYVTKDGGKYRLGTEFFSVGIDVRNSFRVYDTAAREVRRLAEETGEAAWCAVEENGRGVFIYGHSVDSTINPDAVMGIRFPLHCNSVGKAMLSCFPRKRVNAIVDEHGLDAKTDNTITSKAELFETLGTIRERRYALNLAEDVRGIHAVGVPIVADDGTPLGALSVGGAANRLTRTYCEEELAPMVLEAADNVELNLVYD